MKYLRNKYGYICLFVISIILIITLSYFGINMRGTSASFGGTTGTLVLPCNIIYSSNWPVFSVDNETEIIEARKTYVVLGNMFDVPMGYVFDSWNTSSDGTGIKYVENDIMELTEEDVYLYAQWTTDIDDSDDEQADNDSDDKDEGDLSGDSDLDNDDYENSDGSIDEDIENENNELDNSLSTGSSTSGNGSGSIGDSNTGNSSDIISNAPTIGESNDIDSNKETEEVLVTMYEFKFVNDGKEYAKTSCNIDADGTCKLVLPKDNPRKDGLIFKGWSLTSICSSDNIITSDTIVNSNNIYYACYEVELDNKDDNNSYFWLLLSIWIIAGIAIYFSIKIFKNKEDRTRV